MHPTAPLRSLAGALVLCLVLPGSALLVSSPQTQTLPTEAELKAQIALQPAMPAPYLALAKIYVEQGRLEEAEQMISNALALTRRQLATSPQDPPARGPGGMGADYPDAIRVGGSIREPRKLHDVKPVYPSEALAAGVSGLVIIEAVIDRTGHVVDAMVLRSVPMLDDAAETAVRQWEFTPTVLNGEPVEVIMTVTVNFTSGGFQ